MELSAAHRIKDQIRLGLPPLLWGGGKQGGGGTRGGDEAMEHGVAIGIAPSAQGPLQYRIAVRPRSADDLSDAARDYLETTSSHELDIRETGRIRAPQPVAASINPSVRLSLGSSIAHLSGHAGTLGFFAELPSRGVGFVSNNHVIAAEDWGKDGDEIIHPGYGSASRVVGHLVGDYPRLFSPGPHVVDCAFAALRGDAEFDPASIGDGRTLMPDPVSPQGQERVSKVGSRTGSTWGRMTAFAIDDLVVDYSLGPISFDAQIEFESLDDHPFSMPGDSGSLIVTADGHPLGLLFAGSAAGGKTNTGLTYAHPIQSVLDALGITLVTCPR